MSDTKLNLKQVFLTAVITCVFTVLAGVVTFLITDKQPILEYSVSSSPTLTVQGIHKRIFSIEVINSGRKEVADVTATIEIKNGKTEEVAYEASPGLILTEDKQNNSYLLKAATLNPKETFSISIYATVPDSQFEPVIAVRGKGVTGSSKKTGKKGGNEVVFLLAGAFAGLLGLITSSSPLMRKLLGHMPLTVLARSFLRTGSSVGPFDRNELVAYILSLCSLKELSLQIRFAPSETSFRGASDYIVSEALTSEEERKHQFIKALKCMLIIKRINEDSIDVIAAALAKLGGTNEAEIKALREAAVDEDEDPVTLREKIAKLATDSIDGQR